MHCPRCESSLKEFEPSAAWCRYFLCDSCESAWHIVDGVLQMGRNRNKYFEFVQAHPDIWSAIGD